MKNKKNYTWLFGENEGRTQNNNSYYFWEHIIEKEDDIGKYFVLEKNKENAKFVKKLSKSKRKYIVWKNSLKAQLIFRKADMFFCTLSYKDVVPTKKLWKKNAKYKIIKPVIYLQHGTLGMKRIGYNGNHYNNNMFRFFIYNNMISEQYKKENDFKDYQIYRADYHPRYKELVKRSEKNEKKQKKTKQILWFITWREYLGENKETQRLLNDIKYIIRSKKMQEFLMKNNYKLKICLHQFLNSKSFQNIIKDTKSYIEITSANKIDVMDEIAKSDLLITDYSSVGFDFTFLDKPVILYQPDIEEYMQYRQFYCTMEELKQNSIQNRKDFIEYIIKGKFEINQFFKKRLPKDIDYNYVKEGKHIDKMYNDLYHIQKNKISFIGYNFYGVGGTVTATKSLAEGFLEKGHVVELISLKRNTKDMYKLPYGLSIRKFYTSKSKRIAERIKRLLKFNFLYGYLKYDKNKEYLQPYTGYALRKYLKKTNSRTVISTRETLHLFLKYAKNSRIENKIYFFHADTTMIEENEPGIMKEIKKVKLENALFVTEKNRISYIEKYNYNNYENYAIVGNALESLMISPKEEIKPVPKKEKYLAVVLTRISKDREQDIIDIINFGKYLKERNINNIQLNIYGKGDLQEQFEELLYNNELEDYIEYCGNVPSPKEEILNGDLMLDFSNTQSFGMIYLEAIFNGKMIYCKRNVGSKEVLEQIPKCFYENYDELLEKVNNVSNITREELIENYEKLEKKYSRNAVADKVMSVLKK